MSCIQSEDASALDRGTNSRRPLDILQYVSALCDSVTLIFDLFNLILIGGRLTDGGLSLWQVWLLYFQPFWFYCADKHTNTHRRR